MTAAQPAKSPKRLVGCTLDEETLDPGGRDVEHERDVAIYDLLEDNLFAPVGHDGGPYRLHLLHSANRLVFDVRLEDETPLIAHHLSLTPFRKIVKDYLMMCESYFAAIRTSSPSQIEAIDMGRRGLHNEGSELLMERLKNKIEMDFDTARRLFTLITVLHWKG
jgi:uncharacterized protein (UPF0262 family)